MDIFAVRQDIAHGKFENIVVKLKHPQVPLGEKQLSQVKKYMRTILAIQEFNAPNMTCAFCLVGNKFDKSGFIKGEINTNKGHGEKSLAFRADNYKNFIYTWSQLFADFEMRYSHLTKTLGLAQDKLQRNYKLAEEVLEQHESNTATEPPEMDTPL